jgi:hypothetical protein
VNVVLWVVGEPGAGKTTLVRALFDGVQAELVAKPKWTLFGGDACAAGHYTGGTFDGADTVPYSGARAALEFWRDARLYTRRLTVFDGDRFSNAPVVDWFRSLPDAANRRLVCVLLEAPDGLAAARRAERGSNQNEAWLRGRKTKARRFFDSFGYSLCLPADWSAANLAKAARTVLG